MKMMVWNDGDRANQPTLQLQLTVPDDPAMLRHSAGMRTSAEADQNEEQQQYFRATVEEVSDDENSHF